MALVKFGAQTLNVEGIPEGHIIVAESEISRLRDVNNAYSLLKSRVPPDVDESQIANLVEKGRRHDTIVTELSTTKSQLTDTQTKLSGFANIPKEFTVERWNNFVKSEQATIRQQKLDELTKNVLTEVEKEFGRKFVVDPRFIPAETLANFNVDDSDAQKKWRDILDNAHTEQVNFLQKMGTDVVPPTPRTGDVNDLNTRVGITGNDPTQYPKGDIVSDTGVRVGSI